MSNKKYTVDFHVQYKCKYILSDQIESQLLIHLVHFYQKSFNLHEKSSLFRIKITHKSPDTLCRYNMDFPIGNLQQLVITTLGNASSRKGFCLLPNI